MVAKNQEDGALGIFIKVVIFIIYYLFIIPRINYETSWKRVNQNTCNKLTFASFNDFYNQISLSKVRLNEKRKVNCLKFFVN